MAKYFIWNISNTFDVFNSIACNKEFDFGTENQQTTLQVLSKDDCILGVQNNAEIFTILKVCNANGSKLRLVKDFETSNVISSTAYGINLAEDALVEIDEEKYILIENQLKGIEKTKKSMPITSSAEKAPELPYSKNRIIFGAPGTGKSHLLDEQSDCFVKQTNVELDKNKLIANEIKVTSEKKNFKVLYNAIGYRYSEFLDKPYGDLEKQFGSNIYEIYIGAKAKKIADKIVIDESGEEIDYDALVKKEISKITNHVEQNFNAVGFKFGNYLSDFSISELQQKFEIDPKTSQGYWLNCGAQAYKASLGEKKSQKVKYLERVTFHPNYSYAQFVGTYKPVKSKTNQEEITYEYVPGPFMRVYVNAIKNPSKNFLLLIEEINRANVASVFGDVFQLLDRKGGCSQYPITASEDQKNYLESEGIEEDEIKIPSNMYIWATMNSADQGVLPMDAAFKRRWDFEYLGIDDNWEKVKDYVIPLNEDGSVKIRWNDFRVKLNELLTSDTLKVNEDKLLGPFFMSKTSLESALKEPKVFIKNFKSKVLMYLFEDVVKMNPGKLFVGCEKLRYSEICKSFDEKGTQIFGFDCDLVNQEQ